MGTRIGAGGFGITYLGLDLAEEKPMAIKEFFPVSLAERREERVIALPGEDGRYFREALRSFRKEAELLSRFGGVEGIVRYLDYVQENETAYLVMEYVEGENLKQKMRRMEAPFSQEEALTLLYPILLAVDAMHRKNVLHRDISPENLILKPDGTLTLIDFGAAREYSLEEDENLTVILKRGYAPDEQYHSGSRQGPWTDLYACCAVLYQMVSGLLPQDASSRRPSAPGRVQPKAEGQAAPTGRDRGSGGDEGLCPGHRKGHDDLRHGAVFLHREASLGSGSGWKPSGKAGKREGCEDRKGREK